MDDRLRKLALGDGRYSPEAFRFLLEGLEYSIQSAGKGHLQGGERHVSGNEVLNGLVEYARRSFGPLAGQVWRTWGLTETLDWGRIVFLLVEAEMLSRQDSDTIEDFQSELDFEQEFVEGYPLKLPNTI